MLELAGLFDELERSVPAKAAMAMLEQALARRSIVEQQAFWRAIEIAYVSRKAPPEPIAIPAQALPVDAILATGHVPAALVAQ